MSILNQEINKSLPVNLKVCKRGGADNYSEGEIVAFTEKAILVVFKNVKKQVWLSKRNVYNNGDNYGCSAKMWNSWERVIVEDQKETLEESVDNLDLETMDLEENLTHEQEQENLMMEAANTVDMNHLHNLNLPNESEEDEKSIQKVLGLNQTGLISPITVDDLLVVSKTLNKLELKKGDMIRTAAGQVGKIHKYYSNKEIMISVYNADHKPNPLATTFDQVSKEQIVEKLTKEQFDNEIRKTF